MTAISKAFGRPGRLWRIFSSLTTTQLANAATGLLFWTLAAHTFMPDQLGMGAALITAVTASSAFGVLGVHTLLLERLGTVAEPDRRSLLGLGLLTAMAGGALVAIGWVGLTKLVRLPGALGDISMSAMLLLIVTAGLAATCTTFDNAAVGLGAAAMQLRRNLVAAALRIIALVGATQLGARSGQVILIAWAIGLIGSLLLSPLQRHLPPRAGSSPPSRRRLFGDYWRVAASHHGLSLAQGSSLYLLPLVVASIVAAAEVAYFNQARLFSDVAHSFPFILTVALFATARNPAGFRRSAPRTLALGLLLALGFLGGAALLGRYVLLAFGEQYSVESLPILLLLLAAGPAIVVKDHFVVLRRLQGRRTNGAVVMALWNGAELTAAVLGGVLSGLTGLLIAWVATSTACALLALPVVIRAIRRSPMPTDSPEIAGHPGPD